MNPHTRYAAVLTRIASLARIGQIRQAEAARQGPSDAALSARLEPIIDRLEVVADEMEKALT